MSQLKSAVAPTKECWVSCDQCSVQSTSLRLGTSYLVYSPSTPLYLVFVPRSMCCGNERVVRYFVQSTSLVVT